MTYRKIDIYGKEYEYVIGGSNIHIKGFGDFPTSVHGNPVYYPRSEDDHEGIRTKEYVATPRTVRALILGQPTPVPVEGKEIRLMVNPFEVEIHARCEYTAYCPRRYYALKDDI